MKFMITALSIQFLICPAAQVFASVYSCSEFEGAAKTRAKINLSERLADFSNDQINQRLAFIWVIPVIIYPDTPEEEVVYNYLFESTKSKANSDILRLYFYQYNDWASASVFRISKNGSERKLGDMNCQLSQGGFTQ